MDFRFRLVIIAVTSVIVLGAWTFPEWYPLLNTETITEAYRGLEMEAQADFLALPDDVRRAYEVLRDGSNRQNITANPDVALALLRARLLTEDTVTSDEEQLFVPPSDIVLRRGTFRTIDLIRGAEGTVTIYQNPDLSRTLRIDEFRTTRAPDLRLVLTRNPDPTDERGVGVDYIEIGQLKGTVGGQSYRVPDGVDFRQYPILAIYSQALDYVISTATLR